MHQFAGNINAEHKIFQGEARSLTARSTEGFLGILPGHAPLLTLLAVGPLRCQTETGTMNLVAGDGLLEVTPTGVTVLVDSIKSEDQGLDIAQVSKNR